MNTSVLIIVSILSVMIVVEWFFSQHHDHENYEPSDTRANIGIALLGLVVNSTFKVFTLIIFSHVAAYSFFDFTMHWIEWIILFVLADFIYYVFHYVGHVSRFFWAAHVVHHSSVKYNLSTAVRAPVLNFFYRFTFWIPLCIVGFPPYSILAIESGIFIYQFFLHTRYVGKLGWLEYIFNTPSHHRVHHSVNPKYIDKNFGGVLIIWDRMFNTFQKEEEEPVYGITTNLTSCKILTILFHEWLSIKNDFMKAETLKEKWKIVFAPPGTAKKSSSNTWEISHDEDSDFTNPENKTLQSVALVTGASSGIGKALAEELAKRNYSVVLVALPEVQLYNTAKELELKYAIKTWSFSGDLSNPDVVERLSNFCSSHQLSVRILVNCAGIGNVGLFCDSDWNEAEKIISLNNLALVNVCSKFLPSMVSSPEGYILNVGSMASFFSIPGKAVYSASKSFVYSFSKSLRLEVRNAGISVSCLCPGSTPGSDRTLKNIERTNYKGTFFCQRPAEVAEEAIANMFEKKFRIIPGWKNKLLFLLWLLIPSRVSNFLLSYIFIKRTVPTKVQKKKYGYLVPQPVVIK